MLISDKPHPRRVSQPRILQYIEFALNNGYPLEAREIHPLHVALWVTKLVKDEGYSIFNSACFRHTFYFLFNESKYPMSVFLTINNLKYLLQRCNVINSSAFSYLFDISLKASKQFTTDMEVKELLNKLPSEVPENRDQFKDWFKTHISKSFRMTTAVELYVWFTEQNRSIIIDNHTDLLGALKDYIKFLEINFTKGKYKKTRIFITYMVRFIDGVKERVKLLNDDTMKMLEDFIDYKLEGLKIHYESQLVSETKWSHRNAIGNQRALETFLRSVIDTRGCSKTTIDEFSVYSLKLEDYTNVTRSRKIGDKSPRLLKQFLPYLIENPNMPEK